jgi:hypothetical protein
MPGQKKWIGIGVILVMAGLIFWMFSLRSGDTLAELVPEDAAWFVEIERPSDALKALRTGLDSLAAGRTVADAMLAGETAGLEELLKRDKELNGLFSGITLGISAHTPAGRETGYLFYTTLSEEERESMGVAIKKRFSPENGYRTETRDYMGKTILDITLRSSQKTFSIATLGDRLAASYSAFLVEEVIRHSGVMFKPGFAARLRRDSRFAAVSKKPVRLYLNLKTLPDFLRLYLQPAAQSLSLLSLCGDAAIAGFGSPENGSRKSEGFLIQDPEKTKGGNPGPIDPALASFVPEPGILTFQIQSAGLWKELSGKPTQEPEAGSIGESFGKAVEPEILVGICEGDGLKKVSRILVARVRDREQLLQYFLKLESLPGSGEIYRESYEGTRICQYPRPGNERLPGAAAFSDGFPLFYALEGNYLILADEAETLRRSITRYKKPGRAPSRDFSSRHLHFTWDVARSVPFLMDLASGPLKSGFKNWIPVLKSLQSLEVKDIGEPENPSLGLVLNQRPRRAGTGSFQQTGKTFLDTTLVTRPFRLEPRYPGEPFWLVQDQKKQTHILDSKLVRIRTLVWPESWCSPPQILDLPEKAGWNLLLSMPHALRLYQTDGNPIPAFSPRLSDSLSNFEHVRVVDYDHSLQHRIFAATRYGPVFAFDNQGRPLPEWNPWKWDAPLAFAPRHVRIGEKDLLVMADIRGRLLVTNRKGQMQPGFPFEISGRTLQPFFVEEGLRLSDSYLYVLTDLGLMQKISLDGKEASRFQLFRPDKNTRFQLLPDQKQKTFWLARITDTRISFFDQSYRFVFDHVYAGGTPLIQHFQFGASNKIICVTDKAARSTRLYNETGGSIHAGVLESDEGVDILPVAGKSDQYRIIRVFANRITADEFIKE